MFLRTTLIATFLFNLASLQWGFNMYSSVFQQWQINHYIIIHHVWVLSNEGLSSHICNLGGQKSHIRYMTEDWRIGLNKVKQDSIFCIPLHCRNFVDLQEFCWSTEWTGQLFGHFFLQALRRDNFLLCYWNSRELGKATKNNDFGFFWSY